MSSEASALLGQLKQHVDSGDVANGKNVLNKLKIAMLEFPSPPSDAQLQVATEALEFGALLTISDGDIDAFARNISQLKPYYAASGVSDSDRKCHILGLNLMYLLVDNRLSEFHSELELLSEKEANSQFVNFPINLERQLMVGIYDEVLDAGLNVPHPSYQFFMDNLLQTVRDSIADCIEVSYKTMKLKDVKVMMKFETEQELLDYIQECRDDWIINGEELCFQPPPSGTNVATDIPSMKLISQSLSYATEMERIV